MLALVDRGDPVVKRTPAEIQLDKDRLAKAKARSEEGTKSSSRRKRVAS